MREVVALALEKCRLIIGIMLISTWLYFGERRNWWWMHVMRFIDVSSQ